ncbi:MAG TPA: SGNH/GDSL hydrolase family protein, partial [Candidatus Limnocylindrales bacterium]|nr:SGNH/GDSL hydrolase family protein [Candidatus Limnocylindrales bacterium]
MGTGTTPDQAFPAVLVRLWGDAGVECDLRNPAVNGFRTDDLVRDELPLLRSFRPTLVTLLIGANDIVAALRATGVDDAALGRYRAQLRAIHERITADAPDARRFALPQPDWSVTPAGASFGDPGAVARAIERYNEIARAECVRT